MPDLHTVCADIKQSMQEFDSQIAMCKQTGIDLDVNYEVIMRATKSFLDENKDWVYFVFKIGKPVLLEILPRENIIGLLKWTLQLLIILEGLLKIRQFRLTVESGKDSELLI